MRSRSFRPVIVVLALLLSLALLPACGGGRDTADTKSTPAPAVVSDPSAPGPYPVGVTEITFERSSSTTGEPRFLKTTVWYPAADSAKDATPDETLQGVQDAALTTENLPLPIILFSHGSGGTPNQSTFYTAHLASYGFVVVAPPHPGNTLTDCNPWPCADPQALIDAFVNRPPDITFALESMLRLNDDPKSMFHNAIDGSRAGMSGHSFGGLVTLQLATGTPGPFLAALAMAPPLGPGLPLPRGSMDIPLLLMGGGKDTACPLPYIQTYYDSLNGSEPRFLVDFPRGGHLAYTGVCLPNFGSCGADEIDQEKAHRLINFYATAFFKTYVAGETGYTAFLEPSANGGDPDVRVSAVLP